MAYPCADCDALDAEQEREHAARRQRASLSRPRALVAASGRGERAAGVCEARMRSRVLRITGPRSRAVIANNLVLVASNACARIKV